MKSSPMKASPVNHEVITSEVIAYEVIAYEGIACEGFADEGITYEGIAYEGLLRQAWNHGHICRTAPAKGCEEARGFSRGAGLASGDMKPKAAAMTPNDFWNFIFAKCNVKSTEDFDAAYMKWKAAMSSGVLSAAAHVTWCGSTFDDQDGFARA